MDDESWTEEPERSVADGGVRVESTGIALVHEGEYIGPEPWSVASVTSYVPPAPDLPPALTDRPGEVHYWFPVEIEVVGGVDPELADAIVDRVFDELQRELASRP